MKKLKPCPFCGAKLEVKKHWYPRTDDDAYIHPANGCILSNFSSYNGFPTEGELVKKWNTRTKLKPRLFSGWNKVIHRSS